MVPVCCSGERQSVVLNEDYHLGNARQGEMLGLSLAKSGCA